MRQNKTLDRVIAAGNDDPLLTRRLAPQLSGERSKQVRTLHALGLSVEETHREIDRIDRLTIGDCLLEASAWNVLAERSSGSREAVRAGLLLSRVCETCHRLESTGGAADV